MLIIFSLSLDVFSVWCRQLTHDKCACKHSQQVGFSDLREIESMQTTKKRINVKFFIDNEIV